MRRQYCAPLWTRRQRKPLRHGVTLRFRSAIQAGESAGAGRIGEGIRDCHLEPGAALERHLIGDGRVRNTHAEFHSGEAGSSFWSWPGCSLPASSRAVVAQTPTAEQIEIFQNLPPDQQRAILDAMGSQAGSGVLGAPGTTARPMSAPWCSARREHRACLGPYRLEPGGWRQELEDPDLLFCCLGDRRKRDEPGYEASGHANRI